MNTTPLASFAAAATIVALAAPADAHDPRLHPPAPLEAAAPAPVAEVSNAGAPDARPVIDLAICLDTSGSMNGLIDAARQKLWAIVNDLALAEPTPRLRVALLTFGNDGHAREEGWVAVQTPFTEDLDLVSKQLFALTTNGGTELVGRVLRKAGTLDWTPSTNALALAIVAGNESADQDQEFPFRTVCRELITRGIMVNSIYCGPVGDELAPAWKEVALLADGQFASIDKDHGTVVIETPFDAELTDLNAALNRTYIPIGAAGEAAWLNQAEQDDNAAGLNSAAAAQRAQTKASALYHCSWDLVDACRAGEVVLAEVEEELLPEAMRDMAPEERQAHLDAMQARRDECKALIAEKNTQREVFVQAEMKRRALDDSGAFDVAVRRAIRAQAASKGFRFPEPAAAAPPAEEAAAVPPAG